MPLKITILGSNGRLGSQIAALAGEDSDFFITRSCAEADVIIDVSSYLACKDHIAQALEHKKPLVIGTTGHPSENHPLMEKAALSIPLLFASNFSLVAAVCLEAASFIKNQLKGNCSIEIREAHHTHKKDSPSGTALALAQALNNPPIHSLRAGEIIGDHTVVFSCEEETLELKHHVASRKAFAEGALKAALFLAHQTPRLYSMKDILYATR